MKITIKLILVIIIFNFSFPAQTLLQKDFPVLNKVYQAENKRADYIIVIDQSGSMKNYWSNVKRGISALINSLPNEDYVSILGFSAMCQPLVVPRRLESVSKNELISQIKSLPNPVGQKTDFYEAIDKTLDEINRPNSNELKFLFFITDFINDPPTTTRWNNTNIYLLKDKYERIIGQTNRLLKLYALQLPLEINAGKDYDKFASIFHTISSPIFLNQSTLIEWFDRMKAEIEREKLRMLVENDLKSAIEIVAFENSISPINKNSHFNIQLKNKSMMPVEIDSIVVLTEEYGKIQTGLKEVTSSNEEIELKLELNNEMLSQKGTFFTRYPFKIKSFEIHTSAKEITEFGKLNLNQSNVYKIDKQISSSFLVGFNYWQFLIAITIIILLFYYFFYPCLKPVWLFDKKNIRVSMDLNDQIVELSTTEFVTNKKKISFDNNIIVEDPQSQTGKRQIFKFTINFITQKPKCIIRKPKAGTYVSVDGSENNYDFKLFEKVKNKEIRLSSNITSEPIDFREGITIEATKLELGMSNKLKININPKY